MDKYYDTLYGRNQRLVLWGVVVNENSVNAEIGAFGDSLPSAIALFSNSNDHTTPVATVALRELSGIADEGLMTDINLPILKN
jgi:hypothetical protein